MPSPLIPPDWFVTNVNEKNPDLPNRTALDPAMMALWHMVSQPPPGSLLLVTGC